MQASTAAVARMDGKSRCLEKFLSRRAHAARKPRRDVMGGPNALECLLELQRTSGGRSRWCFTGEAVHVREIPRKGLGVIARRCFGAGECILAESPLATWEIDVRSEFTDTCALERRIEELTPAARQSFYELCDSKAAVDGQRSKTAFGIWTSNAYALETGDCFAPADEPISRTAVFCTICRINHACRPNAHIAWNPSLGVQTVYALRQIACGEEGTVSFVGAHALAPTPERRARLERTKCFVCACEACSLEGDARAKSEDRIRKIAIAEARLHAPTDVIAHVEELWQLTAAEGAPLIWQRAAVLAAMMHAKQAGRLDVALLWAKRGASSAHLALGGCAPTTRKFQQIVEMWER